MRKEFELYQDEEGYIYDITTDLEQIIIRDLYKAMKRNNEKTDEIERLHSIIKEVREYIENKVMSSNEIIDGLKKIEVKELLEILERENI